MLSLDVLDISGTAESDAGFAKDLTVHKVRVPLGARALRLRSFGSVPQQRKTPPWHGLAGERSRLDWSLPQVRLDANGKRLGKREYQTPQSQEIVEDGFGGNVVNVNLNMAMKVRGGLPCPGACRRQTQRHTTSPWPPCCP